MGSLAIIDGHYLAKRLALVKRVPAPRTVPKRDETPMWKVFVFDGRFSPEGVVLRARERGLASDCRVQVPLSFLVGHAQCLTVVIWKS